MPERGVPLLTEQNGRNGFFYQYLAPIGAREKGRMAVGFYSFIALSFRAIARNDQRNCGHDGKMVCIIVITNADRKYVFLS